MYSKPGRLRGQWWSPGNNIRTVGLGFISVAHSAMIQGESRERNDSWYPSHHTCTLALRELRQTMRWRLWDSNNPSVRTKGRSEKNTGKTKGKTRRGSETGKQMNRLSPKLMSWGSLLSIYSLLPIPSYTDIKLRRPNGVWGKERVWSSWYRRPHPGTFQ